MISEEYKTIKCNSKGRCQSRKKKKYDNYRTFFTGEKSCENFLSILTFSREKSVLTKVVPYDARSLKKIGLKLSQNGGGRPVNGNFPL